MASSTITFDPDSGVPYGANLTIYGGTDFTQTFNVKNTSSSAFDFSSYSAAGRLTKSLGVGATTGGYTAFTVSITNATGGILKVSLTDTQTKKLSQGRYMYDVLVTLGSTTYPLVNGNVYVYNTVTQQT